MALIKLKKRKAMKVAYIEHVGAYDTVPFDTIMKKLYAWAKEKKVRPGFKPLTIYPDDPKVIPASQLRSWVAIPIAGDVANDGEVRIFELQESLTASYKHAAPASEYANSYKALIEWAEKEGYMFIGPPIETYPKKPKVKDDKTIIFAEIQFPVRKK